MQINYGLLLLFKNFNLHTVLSISKLKRDEFTVDVRLQRSVKVIVV